MLFDPRCHGGLQAIPAQASFPEFVRFVGRVLAVIVRRRHQSSFAVAAHAVVPGFILGLPLDFGRGLFVDDRVVVQTVENLDDPCKVPAWQLGQVRLLITAARCFAI